MKHQREYIDYLLDMRDAIEKIEGFTNGMSYDQFVNDNKTVFVGHKSSGNHW